MTLYSMNDVVCCSTAIQADGARYADRADTPHHDNAGAAAVSCGQVRDGVGRARWVGSGGWGDGGVEPGASFM